MDASEKKVREVLILVQEGHTADLVYQLPEELCEGMQRRGIAASIARFGTIPNTLFTSDQSQLELEDLEDARDGYIVLVFGNASFIDPEMDRFTLEDLRNWPSIGWFETRPEERWDEYTAIVHKYLEIFPATREGVASFLGKISAERGESLELPDFQDNVFVSLEHHLGEALRWATACALYQPMPLGMVVWK